MIRIGMKPKISFVAASNDMGHFTPSCYVTSSYHYISYDMYVKFLQFTDSDLKNPYPDEEGELLFASGDKEMMQTAFAKRVRDTINLNPSKSLIWQYDGLSPDLKSFRRGVVVFAERNFVVWSWLDANIKLSMLDLICRVLNFIRKPKVRAEIKAWEKYRQTLS